MKNITIDIDLEIFLENFPGNNYFKNIEGVYLGCNHNMAQLAKLDSSDDIVGKTDATLPWKKIADKIFFFDQEIIEQDKEITSEWMFQSTDESTIVYWMRAKPYKNKRGEMMGILGTLTDITQQKINEIKEKQQQLTLNTYLKNTINNLPEAIYWVDKSGVMLGCNDIEAQMFGLKKADQVIGKTMHHIVQLIGWDKKSADLCRKNDREVMLAEKAKSIEEICFCPNGEEKIFLSNKAPLYDRNKNLIGFIGTSINITERKNMEKALLKANQTKTEFLANMTHDVKTPLVTIVGLSKLLMRNLTDQNLSFAQNLLDISQELLKFFNSCIELSKLEYEGISTHTEIFDLKCLLNEIFNLFQLTAKEKNIDLNMRFDERIPISLLGNRANVYRILLNLVGNAVKFTQKGSITIRAELSEKSTDQEALVKLIITDTGVGIPQHKQDKIFERFTRLSSSHEGHARYWVVCGEKICGGNGR